MVTPRTGVAVVAWLVVALSACKKGDASSTGGVAAGAPTFELVRAGVPVALSSAAQAALVVRIDKALAGCNFSSDKNAHWFEGVDLDALWKKREARAHLRARYPKRAIVASIAGPLEYDEVLLAVDEPYGPEPALIKRGTAIVALKKCGYDDRTLGCDSALKAYFTAPPSCPPGF